MSLLTVERLSKNFRGLAAISDVSFAIAAGSITSIIGPNGAGKSTMFNLITGYLPLTAGEIRFRDKRITGMATNRIAELGIARAFQIARPFRDLTVFENVRIGALFGKAGPRDVVATTHRAMELASIAALAEQPASSLTVGQLRHLEVARAIATRADLLLADENLRINVTAEDGHLRFAIVLNAISVDWQPGTRAETQRLTDTQR